MIYLPSFHPLQTRLVLAEIGTPSRATHGFIYEDSVVFIQNESDEFFFPMFAPAGNACPHGFMSLILGHDRRQFLLPSSFRPIRRRRHHELLLPEIPPFR